MRPSPITLTTPDLGRPGARVPGSDPFWAPGTVITWQTSDGFYQPMRVVRDSPEGLVAWLSSGSDRHAMVLADGGPLRRDAGEDHLSERYPSSTGRWEGPGILRISPTGLPWSIWLFWDDDGMFSCWYVNLESPHLRDQTGTWSEDQILDLVIHPDGTVSVKDSEDLDRAVAAGRASAADAAQIRRNAELARDYYTSGGWPFDPEWTRYTPPADWGPLTLDTATPTS